MYFFLKFLKVNIHGLFIRANICCDQFYPKYLVVKIEIRSVDLDKCHLSRNLKVHGERILPLFVIPKFNCLDVRCLKWRLANKKSEKIKTAFAKQPLEKYRQVVGLWGGLESLRKLIQTKNDLKFCKVCKMEYMLIRESEAVTEWFEKNSWVLDSWLDFLFFLHLRTALLRRPRKTFSFKRLYFQTFLGFALLLAQASLQRQIEQF